MQKKLQLLGIKRLNLGRSKLYALNKKCWIKKFMKVTSTLLFFIGMANQMIRNPVVPEENPVVPRIFANSPMWDSFFFHGANSSTSCLNKSPSRLSISWPFISPVPYISLFIWCLRVLKCLKTHLFLTKKKNTRTSGTKSFIHLWCQLWSE